MNIIKPGNFQKLLTFTLIVLLLAFIAVIAVSGRDAPDDVESEVQDGTVKDEEQNGVPSPDSPDIEDKPGDEVVDKTPEHTYYLTGTECTEEMSLSVPYAFVTSSSMPSYGISRAALIVEIPIENGESRFIVYNPSISELGKIGAFAPTRTNISSVSTFFGGNLVGYGEDDVFITDANKRDLDLDLSKSSDYYYTENIRQIFSTGDMIADYAADMKLSELQSASETVFSFADFDEVSVGKAAADTVCIPYSDTNTTSFNYDSKSNIYYMYKSGTEKKDMLTAECASFTNIFVLFADSTTYEKATGIQTVINTSGKGSGYYFSYGKMTEIRWYTENNKIIFETLVGDELTVNRGSSYIGYYKSSSTIDIIYG